MDPLTRDLLGASPALRRLVLGLVRDEHTADDLVQETWVAALRRRDRPPQDPGRWAFAFVRRLLPGVRRREGRRREQEALAAESPSALGPDELLERRSFLKLIARTAEELDEPYRTVIRLRYWEDLSPPEIAVRLGRPHDTVKTQLRRGLEILRERFDREHDGDRKAWLAPLGASFERLVQSPAPWGLPVGALLAAAVVPVIVWLGWTSLRETPRTASTTVGQATTVHDAESDLLAPLAAGHRVAASAVTAVDPTVPPPDASPRIAVAVVDDLGRPVAQADVFVLARELGFRSRGTTDQGGAFELNVEESEIGAGGSGDLADRLILYAYKPGHAASPNNLMRCSRGTTSRVRLELPGPELVLEGRVTDAAGCALPGAEVEVVSRDGLRRGEGDLLIEAGTHWERADAAGSFTMTGLSPGVHLLAVQAPGWVPSRETVDGRTGGVVECALVLTEAGSVAGVVRDEHGDPVPGALLTHNLSDLHLYDLNAARAGPAGHYRIDDLRPGRRMLWAQDPDRSGRMDRTWIEVGEGLETWNPVLEPVDGIKLRVVDESGVGLGGWLVTCSSLGWMRRLETGPDGRAQVFDLPPDQAIEVMVRRESSDPFPRAALTGLTPAADETLLAVSPSDPVGSVTGVLLTEQGVPPAGAKAWLVSTTIWHATSEVVDPSSGEFTFERIPEGVYDLKLIWGGHGGLDLGRVELEHGARFDLGLVRMPATGRVSIEWSWPLDEAHEGLRYELLQGTVGGTATTVARGSAPPPAHFELLPGPYILFVEQSEILQQRPFEVESGRDVQVVAGPEPGER